MYSEVYERDGDANLTRGRPFAATQQRNHYHRTIAECVKVLEAISIFESP